MSRFVVFSGAGMSAESGLNTFRGQDGLWEGTAVEDVATPEAWRRNPEWVTRFYNERRKQLYRSQPNLGHRLIAGLESQYEVAVITQNVDDLHEQAGSSSILHLHGELRKLRSEKTGLVYDATYAEQSYPDHCPDGGLLRPHIVWFGEAVPNLSRAAEIISAADLFLVIGTSLQVYPAAGLIHYTPKDCRRFLIDPDPVETDSFQVFQSGASEGLKLLYRELGLHLP